MKKEANIQKVDDLTLFELKNTKEVVADIIRSRQKIESNIECDRSYRQETKKYQAYIQDILKEIDVRYDDMYKVNKVGFEFIENILDRESDKLLLDDEGHSIIEKFKTNIDPFDTYLLDGGGFNYGSLVGIAGESNAGKSDIVYMFMRSAIKQGLKIHLHSYELGYEDIFMSFSEHQKNKLRTSFKDPEHKELLSIDMLSKELKDLKRMINMRADDGCKIFILDSLFKTTIDGRMVLDREVNDVMEVLRVLAKTRGLLIFIIASKDKSAKVENRYEIYGSVMQMHFYDYLFFIGYEDITNMATQDREIVMVKNRGQDIKKSVITSYDSANHTINFLRMSGAIGDGNSLSKASAWVSKSLKK